MPARGRAFLCAGARTCLVRLMLHVCVYMSFFQRSSCDSEAERTQFVRRRKSYSTMVQNREKHKKIAFSSSTFPRVSGASERANGRASGPVLQSVFLAVIDHRVVYILCVFCEYFHEKEYKRELQKKRNRQEEKQTNKKFYQGTFDVISCPWSA